LSRARRAHRRRCAQSMTRKKPARTDPGGNGRLAQRLRRSLAEVLRKPRAVADFPTRSLLIQGSRLAVVRGVRPAAASLSARASGSPNRSGGSLPRRTPSAAFLCPAVFFPRVAVRRLRRPRRSKPRDFLFVSAIGRRRGTAPGRRPLRREIRAGECDDVAIALLISASPGG